MGFFPIEREGSSPAEVRWLLIAVASCSRGQTAGRVRLSSCGSHALEPSFKICSTQAYLLRSIWDLTGSGIEPMSPTLQADSLPLSHQRSSPNTLGSRKQHIRNGSDLKNQLGQCSYFKILEITLCKHLQSYSPLFANILT